MENSTLVFCFCAKKIIFDEEKKPQKPLQVKPEHNINFLYHHHRCLKFDFHRIT